MTDGMTTLIVEVELPAEVVELLGSPDQAAARAREALILSLLRDGQLSQGQAGQLLGLNRWQLLELMARQAIPSGPETADDMTQELETARRIGRQV